MSCWGSAVAPRAKTVLVYRNGDPFFPGRRVVVNPRRVLTLEVLLGELTVSLGAAQAVRSLHTPRHGRRLEGLHDLRHGGCYVAVGWERFRRLDSQLLAAVFARNAAQAQRMPVPPPFPSCRGTGSSRALGCFHCSVFRNGDLLSPPFPLPVSRSPPLPWATLLAMLTGKAALPSGAVHKLCRLDGAQVCAAEELLNGSYYVAVGNDGYKNLPYMDLLVPRDSAGRMLWYV
ncbi:DCD2B protein, partial [Urocolius indicus]|nr:DCD2B protein [Urocolius indicus]